jgi:uncharacterized membrane-anchored protein YitT (DUF2179 family)
VKGNVMNQLSIKNHLVKMGSIIVGTFLMAYAISTLMIPNKMLFGGVTGFAILSELLFGFDTAIVAFLINIPLFVLAYFKVNKVFFWYSFIGMAALSGFIYLTRNLVIKTDDILVAAILSGILNGIGAGIIFKTNCSTGGIDIVAKIVSKYMGYSISTIILALDILIIILSISFFGVNISIYTFINMYILSAVTKFIIDGLNYKKSIFIISDEYEAISEAILIKINRGVTLIDATGGYSKEKKKMIYCVVGIREVAKIKTIVRNMDEEAFMTVSQTYQTFGEGFVNLKHHD